MKFEKMTKNKEVAYITKLLAIFGTVEADQMRKLFSHLSDAQYGKIMSRLHLEGIVCHDSSGRYISTNRYALDKTKIKDSVRVFWAFIEIKDKAKDFCGGCEPALLSFSSEHTEYDMIPVDAKNVKEVMDSAESIPKYVRRLLITPSLDELDDMIFRLKNDYVMEVDQDGKITTYEM